MEPRVAAGYLVIDLQSENISVEGVRISGEQVLESDLEAVPLIDAQDKRPDPLVGAD